MPDPSNEEKARTLTLVRSKLDHDLRSNMNVILGYCSMLKEELASGQATVRIMEDLGHIEAAGEDLLELNNRIGDLLAVQDGTWESARTRVELDRIVHDVFQKISARFPGWIFERNGNAHLDHGDPVATTRLLYSLVDRLCRAISSSSNPSIELSVSGNRTTVILRCMMDTATEPERRKLLSALQALSETASEFDSIRDFDNYYCAVMCELAGANIHIVAEHLACRVTFGKPARAAG